MKKPASPVQPYQPKLIWDDDYWEQRAFAAQQAAVKFRGEDMSVHDAMLDLADAYGKLGEATRVLRSAMHRSGMGGGPIRQFEKGRYVPTYPATARVGGRARKMVRLPDYVQNCANCNKSFASRRKGVKYCSRECAHHGRWGTP